MSSIGIMVYSYCAISYDQSNNKNHILTEPRRMKITLCKGQDNCNGPTLVHHVNCRPNSTKCSYKYNFLIICIYRGILVHTRDSKVIKAIPTIE